MPKALNNFAKNTNCGEFEFALFWLTERILIASFMSIGNLTFAICYLAQNEAAIGTLLRNFKDSIDEIKQALENEI